MQPTEIIVAIDIGTTETKTVFVSPTNLIDSRQTRYGLCYPRESCVEQNPEDIKSAIFSTAKALTSAHPDLVSAIRGVVFTSQMQNTLPVTKDGKPLMNFLSWMDQRSQNYCRDVFWKGFPRFQGYTISKLLKFLKITGGTPGFTGKDTIAKIGCLKHTQPDLYNQTYKFLDCKDYAIYLATGKFVTSYDMGHITWMMEAKTYPYQWSDKIHQMYGLDAMKMPELHESTAIVGEITAEFAERTGIPAHIPVINGAGDLLSAAIGSGAVGGGELHINVGTAGWVGCHHPYFAIDIPHYVGAIISGIPQQYFLISKQETLGGALDWVIGSLNPRMAEKRPSKELYDEVDALVASSPPGANRVIFTPWLYGERSPINDPHLRGQFFNLGMNNTRADLFRAVFEGIAFNLRWGKEAVEKLAHKKGQSTSSQIRMIGGGARANIWCQIMADVLQSPIRQMENPQMASAIGAATIAMISLGIYKKWEDVVQLAHTQNLFNPNTKVVQIYQQLYSVFQNLYFKNRDLFMRLNQF